MKYALLLVAPILAASIAARPALAGALTITVDHVPDARGHVLVAVCLQPDFLTMHCSYVASAPSRAGTVHMVVPHVAPGVYALQAWQDANDNHQIDRDAIGIPTEAMGFSRDARMWFGPPRFSAAAVQVGTADSAVGFSLRGF